MVSGVNGNARIGWQRVTACATVVLASALFVMTVARTTAQTSSAMSQNVAPVYEGWEQNADGSFNLVFGYFNRNWQEIDVPMGPATNAIEPGGPDQGQPTHFYPRRTKFLFRIRVPKDFGKNELVWTLTVNGKTEKAYASLKPDYIINNMTLESNFGGGGLEPNSNKAPELKFEGALTRNVKVGEPVQLVAFATDDGIPKARNMPPAPVPARAAIVPVSATGLRFSWFVYRGAGKVTFDPQQFEAWEDIRDGHDSPYSPGWVTPQVPPDNKWAVRATFSQPGTYVLRGFAHDGGLATSRDVTFVVGP